MKKQLTGKLGGNLRLHRETLKNLNEQNLAQAAGAYSDVSLCYATQTRPGDGCGPTRPLCD